MNCHRLEMFRPRHLLWTLVALTLGCASLPPAQPATDVKGIAGQWHGTLEGRNGFRAGVVFTIMDDGRYLSVLDRPAGEFGTTFPGTVTVENGRYRTRSDRTGNLGTLTLHQGDGKRVLALRSDNSNAAADLVPANP